MCKGDTSWYYIKNFMYLFLNKETLVSFNYRKFKLGIIFKAPDNKVKKLTFFSVSFRYTFKEILFRHIWISLHLHPIPSPSSLEATTLLKLIHIMSVCLTFLNLHMCVSRQYGLVCFTTLHKWQHNDFCSLLKFLKFINVCTCGTYFTPLKCFLYQFI